MDGKFVIQVNLMGMIQYVSKVRRDGKNLSLCSLPEDGMKFADKEKAERTSQKVAAIFRTRTIGLIPKINVVPLVY